LEAGEAKDHPGETIDVKKQISFADQDARCFSKGSDGTRYVHNAQAAVDMDSQIILENHIENTVSDARAAGTTIQAMKETLGGVPTALVADSGYANKTTLAACEAEGVTPVCSPGREGHEATEDKREGLEAFSYDAPKDEFCCPHGRVYTFDGGGGGTTAKMYRSEAGPACGCGRLTKGGGSVLRVRASHSARRTFYRLLDVPENQALYRRRKCTVEPVFGQIKFGMGFQRFLHRGARKVWGEWNMVCAAFNLRKMGALMKAKGPGRGATTPPPGAPGLGRSVSRGLSRFLAHCRRLCGSLLAPINAHVELSTQRG